MEDNISDIGFNVHKNKKNNNKIKSLYLCVCERGVAYVSVLNSNYFFLYIYLCVSLFWCIFFLFLTLVECDIAVKPNLKNKLNKYTVHTNKIHAFWWSVIYSTTTPKKEHIKFSAFLQNGFLFCILAQI